MRVVVVVRKAAPARLVVVLSVLSAVLRAGRR
jgi:hypothetical protein